MKAVQHQPHASGGRSSSRGAGAAGFAAALLEIFGMNDLERLVVSPRAHRFGKISARDRSRRKARRRNSGLRFHAGLPAFRYRHGESSRAEQRGIPHHLVDLVEPSEVFTAGEYRRRAARSVSTICANAANLPILTAGTGLYLRALLEGLSDAPQRSEELRERLRQKSRNARARTSSSAACRGSIPQRRRRIAPRDTQKIIRAMEMRLLAGKAVDEIHRRGPHRPGRLRSDENRPDPPRDASMPELTRARSRMMQAGWMEEVRRLIAAGLPRRRKTVSVHRLFGIAPAHRRPA